MIARSQRAWWREVPHGEVFSLPSGDIVRSDALVFLRALRDESADIVFLDPPFNLGKRYGSRKADKDSLADHRYLFYMHGVLEEASRVLKVGGALYLFHIPRWNFIFASLLSTWLDFRHWIAISFRNGYPRPGHLYPAHYSLLYFTKGKPQAFRRPKVPPQRCPHCGKLVKDYGGYKEFVKGGINLSDVWDDVSPVRHSKYKYRAENELPHEIPKRVVDISGGKGGVLVDPFAGTGSALSAARDSGMRFVGCDIERKYCELMVHRLLSEGRSRLRRDR